MGSIRAIDVALALPEVEIDAQGVEVALQGRAGDVGEVAPDQAMAETPGLELGRRPARAVAIVGIGLGPGGGRGIEAVEIVQPDVAGEKRLGGALVGVGEMGRLFGVRLQPVRDRRIGVGAGGDQQAHLEAPVAEVGVAQDLVAGETVQPLDRLADDRGAQVADVHLLGDVGAAVVDQHLRGVSTRRRRRGDRRPVPAPGARGPPGSPAG